MSFWTRERQPLRLAALMRAQLLLLAPLAGGVLLIAFAAALLQDAITQPGKLPSPTHVPALILVVGLGGAIAFFPLRELVRFFWRPPSEYPAPLPKGEPAPDFPEVASYGPLLRVSTATAAGRAYFLTGLRSAIGVTVFAGALLLFNGPLPEVEVFGGLLAFVLGPSFLALSGYQQLQTRVWVFQNGIAYRNRREFTALKWREIKWVLTTVGLRVWPEERDTQLGTNDGRSIRIPTELDDPDATAEFVLQLAYQDMYPRLLAALERGREVAFGDLSLSTRGVRRGEGEDVIPWSRIGEVGRAWGTHVVVMKRDLSAARVNVAARNMPNAWLFLWLAQILHPLRTAPPTLDKPWLRPTSGTPSET